MILIIIQGNVDKVVVVIKNKQDIPMERFIFCIQTMIQIESYNKDTKCRFPLWSVDLCTYITTYSVEGAISSSALGQYLRSFLVKLNMIEAQLGQLPLCGKILFLSTIRWLS